MMDFSANELFLRSVRAQREREAQAAAASSTNVATPRGLRSAVAARLARLALRLDGETTGSLVARYFHAAGRHG